MKKILFLILQILIWNSAFSMNETPQAKRRRLELLTANNDPVKVRFELGVHFKTSSWRSSPIAGIYRKNEGSDYLLRWVSFNKKLKQDAIIRVLNDQLSMQLIFRNIEIKVILSDRIWSRDGLFLLRKNCYHSLKPVTCAVIHRQIGQVLIPDLQPVVAEYLGF